MGTCCWSVTMSPSRSLEVPKSSHPQSKAIELPSGECLWVGYTWVINLSSVTTSPSANSSLDWFSDPTSPPRGSKITGLKGVIVEERRGGGSSLLQGNSLMPSLWTHLMWCQHKRKLFHAVEVVKKKGCWPLQVSLKCAEAHITQA